MAWIYGDVVHHDREQRQEADPFGLSERYRAAVPLVAWTMVGAIELLHYIRALQDAQVLSLDPAVFEQPVVLDSTTWRMKGRAYSAPVGTTVPADALTPLGEEWKPLSLRQPEEAGQRSGVTGSRSAQSGCGRLSAE
ncbi:hypothetical protein [Streptomyces sp. Isolate_45]|uniref:hypothetical protein n=1 Tax=Streptomyces sp. Isolate_45 TaxID=2950111 RepID=UPI002481C243|nr:hypothetical protein [Streptomyces sp. Isolate_45]MDA5286659.1 hypothetical protein [Streptomyces sp. Isolate_45]